MPAGGGDPRPADMVARSVHAVGGAGGSAGRRARGRARGAFATTETPMARPIACPRLALAVLALVGQVQVDLPHDAMPPGARVEPRGRRRNFSERFVRLQLWRPAYTSVP